MKVFENKGTRGKQEQKWHPRAVQKEKVIESKNKFEALETKKEEGLIEEESYNTREDMRKQLNEGIGHESNEPPKRINQTISVADKENNGKACQQERKEMRDFHNTVKDPTEVQNESLNKQSENNVGDET
ncbi:hypothetical protein KY290_013407 [Solanum tuberosum]|uniref:Uncharacterized protein n=1 Tax=Solanum tuberosum TaxID=4113 RepID=A0ABQ7VMX8_SOLTU|nr:hypothetical protein KY285_012871 [Solanum tuberosum]KAH0769426.1 hypothetical protein KY290_013407 [Solanum tuberosum]